MSKTVYTLYVGDHSPEIVQYTFPLIRQYARRCGADLHVITERKFPEWPVTYEKLQIYDLSKERDDEWSIYIDSDALVHPNLPDYTSFLQPGWVCQNWYDPSPLRFRSDHWFERDGRFIGAANWFTIAHKWCRELWHPLEASTYTLVEALDRITPVIEEYAVGISPDHLIDDFVLSHNIARFGLKYTCLRDLDPKFRVPASMLHHQYLRTPEQKVWGVTRETTNTAGEKVDEKVLPGIVDVLNAWRVIVQDDDGKPLPGINFWKEPSELTEMQMKPELEHVLASAADGDHQEP